MSTIKDNFLLAMREDSNRLIEQQVSRGYTTIDIRNLLDTVDAIKSQRDKLLAAAKAAVAEYNNKLSRDITKSVNLLRQAIKDAE